MASVRKRTWTHNGVERTGWIVDYKDLYGRDAKALAALKLRDGGASLATPKTDVAAKPKPGQVANPISFPARSKIKCAKIELLFEAISIARVILQEFSW